ncbi:FHA domain-containing protein [Sporomusa malonica]|uniref:FHA domain-containing protein n=1 Tax=Sporomusa malonica TaxID=112901 RepID=A0A1W2A6T5_9FIRM|nr:FHA domain-containing protein [Sporomusa malonica]SMC55978.1 FHA domain-containing protein [Sporomusa malonica]
MPGKMQILNIIVIVLQYSLVLLVYYFLYRVVNIASKDLTKLAIEPQAYLSLQLQTGEGTGSNQIPKLIVISDEKALLSQIVYPIAESLAIGRSQNNDLIINDTFVSHEHACISKSKQTYLIADLSSTNGTLLNSQRIEEETALADGDVIQIGAVTLKFER